MDGDNQRTRLTLRLIQEAVLSLLELKDFEKISVTDICTEAGINRSTFYRYYENQYQLLESMEKALLDELESHEMSVYLFNPAPENAQKALAITTDSFRCIEKNLNAYRILATRVRPNFMKKFLHTRKPYIKEVLKGKFDEATAEHLADYILSGSQEIIINWIKNDKREAPEEAAELLIRTTRGAFLAAVKEENASKGVTP